VRIGENVEIAAYSHLNGGTHHYNKTDIPVTKQERSGIGIILEDNVWLGTNVKVLDGVLIGKDSIVGAGSVVNKDIPPFTIAGGLPARVIRMRDDVKQ
jgi:acetyltransferase-like isoleucine patch superfamily enzyme